MKVRHCGDAKPQGCPSLHPLRACVEVEDFIRGPDAGKERPCGRQAGKVGRQYLLGQLAGAHSTRWNAETGDAPIQNPQINLVQREGRCPPGGELRIRGKEGRSRTQVALTAFCRRPMVAVNATSRASGRHGPCNEESHLFTVHIGLHRETEPSTSKTRTELHMPHEKCLQKLVAVRAAGTFKQRYDNAAQLWRNRSHASHKKHGTNRSD